MIPVLSTFFAIVILIVFIMAIRLSYAIERETGKILPGDLPRYTNIITSVIGAHVPKEANATRVKVIRLRLLLGVIALCFVPFVVIITNLGT